MVMIHPFDVNEIEFYASDEHVTQILNRGKGVNYVYNKEESKERFPGFLYEVSTIIELQQQLLGIKANLTFAFYVSKKPYSVIHVGGDDFVLLVEYRALNYLITLCYRLQSLTPLAELIVGNVVEEVRDFKGKFLLDIAKDLTFRTKSLEQILSVKQTKNVYRAALHYILGHEIAHVSHGHLEFIASPEYQEVASSTEDKNLTLSALEMDADSSATTTVFMIFDNVIDRGIKNNYFPEDMTGAQFTALIKQQYVLGVFIAHIYHDAMASNYFPKAYPISYVRFLTSSGLFRVVFETNCPEFVYLPDLVRSKLIDCFTNLSGSVDNLGHSLAANIYYGTMNNEVVKEYDFLGEAFGFAELEPLNSRWSRIRPLLEKYQRGGRLAPAIAIPK